MYKKVVLTYGDFKIKENKKNKKLKKINFIFQLKQLKFLVYINLFKYKQNIIQKYTFYQNKAIKNFESNVLNPIIKIIS